MNSKFIKKGIIVAVLTSSILVPVSQVQAADSLSILAAPQQNKAVSIDKTLVNVVAEMKADAEMKTTIKIESAEELQLKEKLSGYAFAVVGEDGYLVVYREAAEESEAAGKVFPDSKLEIVAKDDEWAEVKSGNIVGFVRTENVYSGKKAIERAKEILTEKYQDKDIYTLDQEEIDEAFTVGETVEEEIARLAAEEAARIAAEEARKEAERQALIKRGQSVVDYARQFLGNPYVYGGQSLTRGTDCSGFVRSVYKNFGIYLPRTSYSMRSVGRAVSYSEILPGDIVCYSGHVGIYAGNGQIVNAIDEAHGIGMSNARYSNIITIRRMF